MNESLSMAFGLFCGVALSIPVSLFLLIALTRDVRRAHEQTDWLEPEPVIEIINPNVSGYLHE